jgi:FG-GAP repeat
MLARILKVTILINIYLMLLACGRQDEPVVPAPFPPIVEPFCLEGNPYETFKVTEGILVGDIAFSFDYDRFEYEMGVNHFTDSLSFELPPFNRLFVPDVLSSLSEQQIGNTRALLSDEQLSRLRGANISLSALTSELVFDMGGESQSIVSETDSAELNQEIPLSVGINEIVVKYTAKIEIPYSGAECDLASDITDTELETLTRAIDVVYEYNFSINRESRSDVELSRLEHDTSTLGVNALESRNVSISENILVLGVPFEDSDSRGSFLESELRLDVSSSIINELAPDSGAVFVYTRDDGDSEWGLSAYIKAPNSDPGDMFGYSVSLHGDVLAVSAPGEDSASSQIFFATPSQELLNAQNSNQAINSGAVYLFELENGVSWNEIAYIKPNENLPAIDNYNNSFGEKLVLSDKYLVVGAPKEDSNLGEAGNVELPNSGAVYVYHVPSNNLLAPQYGSLTYSGVIKAGEAGEGDGFGSSIALEAGLLYISSPYEDGGSNAILSLFDGATIPENDPRLDNTNSNSGAVYVYQADTSITDKAVFEPVSYIKASNPDSGDRFGLQLAASGLQLAVSAPYEDGAGTGFNRELSSNSITDSGAVYVFTQDGISNKLFENVYIKPPASAENSLFGSALAFKSNNLVVGHPYYNPSDVVNAGEAIIYTRNALADTWAHLASVFSDNSGRQLGSSVAMDGDSIAIASKSNSIPVIVAQ